MSYIAEEQLCLNADRSKIVPCDSPDAAMNLALPGQELEDDVAAKYGLAGSKKKAVGSAPDEAESADVPEEKAQPAAPQNKAVVSADNKGKAK